MPRVAKAKQSGVIVELAAGRRGELPHIESKAPAVTKAVEILRLLARAKQPLGLNVIARELGLVASSCLHVLRALEAGTLVATTPEDKKYVLGLGLVSLGHSALYGTTFAETSRPELTKIANTFKLTTSALQLDNRNHSMVVVSVAQSYGRFGVHIEVGRRLPAFLSATGRCVAAFASLTPADLRKEFDKLHWDEAPEFGEWLEQVADVKKQGVGVDRGNYIRGFTVVTAPVFDRGIMSRAITSIFAQGQLSDAQFRKLCAALKSAAARLSTPNNMD